VKNQDPTKMKERLKLCFETATYLTKSYGVQKQQKQKVDAKHLEPYVPIKKRTKLEELDIEIFGEDSPVEDLSKQKTNVDNPLNVAKQQQITVDNPPSNVIPDKDVQRNDVASSESEDDLSDSRAARESRRKIDMEYWANLTIKNKPENLIITLENLGSKNSKNSKGSQDKAKPNDSSNDQYDKSNESDDAVESNGSGRPEHADPPNDPFSSSSSEDSSEDDNSSVSSSSSNILHPSLSRDFFILV
jgi:hypothetical protein